MSAIIYCKNCNKSFFQPKHSGKRTFCSMSCAGKYNVPKGTIVTYHNHLKKPKEHHLRMRRKDQANRRARILNQTSPSADKQLIKEIYLNCPEGYEVDHIIPLSKNGLHHQDNLQYLTSIENRKKGNRL
tara:strand:- start:467 stop:853 length:387 start_codon:yes stop_codon:yes gene_type:complete